MLGEPGLRREGLLAFAAVVRLTASRGAPSRLVFGLGCRVVKLLFVEGDWVLLQREGLRRQGRHLRGMAQPPTIKRPLARLILLLLPVPLDLSQR